MAEKKAPTTTAVEHKSPALTSPDVMDIDGLSFTERMDVDSPRFMAQVAEQNRAVQHNDNLPAGLQELMDRVPDVSAIIRKRTLAPFSTTADDNAPMSASMRSIAALNAPRTGPSTRRTISHLSTESQPVMYHFNAASGDSIDVGLVSRHDRELSFAQKGLATKSSPLKKLSPARSVAKKSLQTSASPAMRLRCRESQERLPSPRELIGTSREQTFDGGFAEHAQIPSNNLANEAHTLSSLNWPGEEGAGRKRQQQAESSREGTLPARPIPMRLITLSTWLAAAAWIILGNVFRLCKRHEHEQEARIIAVPVHNGKRRCVLQSDLDMSPQPHIPGTFPATPVASAAAPPTPAFDPIEHLRVQSWEELTTICRQGIKRWQSGKSELSRGLRTPIHKCKTRLHGRNPVLQRAVDRAAARTVLKDQPQPPKKWWAVARRPGLSRLSEASVETSSPHEQSHLNDSFQQPPVIEKTPDVKTRDNESIEKTHLSASTNSKSLEQVNGQSPAPVMDGNGKPIGRWTVAAMASRTNDQVLKDERIDLLTKRARALHIISQEEEEARKVLSIGIARRQAERAAKAVRASKAAQALDNDRKAEIARAKEEALLRKEFVQKQAAEAEAAKEKKEAEYKARALEQLRAREKARAEAIVREEQAAAEEEARREAEVEAKRQAARQIFRGGNLIVAPSVDMNNALQNNMSGKSDATVVATMITGTQLLRGDLARVLGIAGARQSAWLNDASVDCWMASLCTALNESRGWKKSSTSPPPPFAAYSSAWYKQVRDKGPDSIKRWTSRLGIKNGRLDEVETLLFPVNTGAHWTLAVLHGKKRTIEYLDSLGGSGAAVINTLRQVLHAEMGAAYKPEEWNISSSISQHQTNSDDCGVFTCFNALAAVRAKPYTQVTAAKMPDARRLMAAILMNGGFTGDAQLS